MTKIWSGSTPRCQICGLEELSTFMDARIPEGPWAMMCPACFDDLGCQLGTGNGQQYQWTGTVWEKTGG